MNVILSTFSIFSESFIGNDSILKDEGSTNSVIGQHQFKRSLEDEDVLIAPNLMAENSMRSDLMAVATPAKYREKRSKLHSKRAKTLKRSGPEKQEKTKDELMNILGAIRNAKHHKLSRKDIRELAKKAFARIKHKKPNEKPKAVGNSDKKKEGKKVEETADKVTKQKASIVASDVKRKMTVDDVPKVNEKKMSKTAKEDEKAFSNIFEDTGKPKVSEFSEDISKLGDASKLSQMLSDESMTSQKDDFAANLESLTSKSTVTATEKQTEKKASQAIEQEINNAMDEKDASSKVEKKESAAAKKSTIPDLGRNEKIKTLKNLLSKASKSKVPKKFLQQFPAGLRMIAWRELLEKKRKELAELEELQSSDKGNKKSDEVEDRPVTVNIDIGQNTAPGKDTKDVNEASGDKHHIDSHVKYLQKHLSSAQDLRKLISRALIGHCKASGKRILKAFIAMDKALERAQSIATVIGKKFKVDASKIENIVVKKEDEVVESFLRDIFSNFTPK